MVAPSVKRADAARRDRRWACAQAYATSLGTPKGSADDCGPKLTTLAIAAGSSTAAACPRANLTGVTARITNGKATFYRSIACKHRPTVIGRDADNPKCAPRATISKSD